MSRDVKSLEDQSCENQPKEASGNQIYLPQGDEQIKPTYQQAHWYTHPRLQVQIQGEHATNSPSCSSDSELGNKKTRSLRDIYE